MITTISEFQSRIFSVDGAIKREAPLPDSLSFFFKRYSTGSYVLPVIRKTGIISFYIRYQADQLKGYTRVHCNRVRR